MMNLKAKAAVVLILFAPCFTVGAKAMSFEDFARMNNDDEAGYVTFLVEASAQLLKANGHSDQAAKVISLFKDSSNNGGVHRLASNLKTLNSLNNRNATNPNNHAHVYQIEDAMELTLRDVGIIVPAKDLLAGSNDFVATGPPRSRTMGL